ncbi:dihydrolipoyl dehydrogenase family protein [Fodinibius sediminis]|uniref:Pyruvate/2-oxoglutarate dehydrogenase complex, dihydrolipoamide dehydrogenase (E3) component n=1 Tax=Fodinibius sediminis TaxID=1214077 RepID=A0A521CKP7_9BACT|nr:FAD-dependent oxidoreductase [Fodinibius sediminis]SMO60027.1 Pyruvate/2-oxoglutarate dehydrogenase complex, dihydrolipoamide dehydrogenase (E3) component [Fodinibius sediminis]
MKYDYDLLVIGGGAAGLTSAGMGVNFGAKTLLIEANKLGGDCTWTGCVPSKTLLHAAGLAQKVKEAETFGHKTAKQMDFSSILNHVRAKREEVYREADDPHIFRNMGVDVTFGKARFVDPHTISIDSGEKHQQVSSRYIIIATGSKAVAPPVPGLEDMPYLTNETIFELEEQPRRLGIIGAGPVGMEMAQAFQRLGTHVTVFDMQPRILINDDEELAGMLHSRLVKEGIAFRLSASITRVSKSDSGEVQLTAEVGREEQVWTGDALLVAAGRVANHNSLALDKAGIEYTQKGITVNDRCRTNHNHIYAAGDVTGRYQLSHMSEHMAKIATTNALLKMPLKIDTKHLTWSTYTDPELAHVGATEKQLKDKGATYEVYRFPYEKIDRARTDEATDGLIKIFAKKWTGKILGAAIYGRQAGDLISEYALAMRNGVTLRNIADTIHPYPSYGLGVRRAADQWYVKNQSEWQIKLIKWLFGYRGSIPDLSNKDRIL